MFFCFGSCVEIFGVILICLQSYDIIYCVFVIDLVYFVCI